VRPFVLDGYSRVSNARNCGSRLRAPLHSQCIDQCSRGCRLVFRELAESQHSFGSPISHVRSPSLCIVGFADFPCIKPNAMREAPSNAPEDLRQALSAMIAHPIRTIVPPWSWKAAACSAVVRALAFFVTNLQSGH
jgi:hypothetical protein